MIDVTEYLVRVNRYSEKLRVLCNTKTEQRFLPRFANALEKVPDEAQDILAEIKITPPMQALIHEQYVLFDLANVFLTKMGERNVVAAHNLHRKMRVVYHVFNTLILKQQGGRNLLEFQTQKNTTSYVTSSWTYRVVRTQKLLK